MIIAKRPRRYDENLVKVKNIKLRMNQSEKLQLRGLRGPLHGMQKLVVQKRTWAKGVKGRWPDEDGLGEPRRILNVTPKGVLLPTRCNVSATLEGF